MGQQAPTGQQVHALPSLPRWAQSHHVPVSRVGPGLVGSMSGDAQAKRVPGQWVRPGQPTARAGLGSSAGALRCSWAWGKASTKASPDSLSPGTCLVLGWGHVPGPWSPGCLAPLLHCPQRRNFREFCLQLLNHCHSSKKRLGSLVKYLVLFSFCPQDYCGLQGF